MYRIQSCTKRDTLIFLFPANQAGLEGEKFSCTWVGAVRILVFGEFAAKEHTPWSSFRSFIYSGVGGGVDKGYLNSSFRPDLPGQSSVSTKAKQQAKGCFSKGEQLSADDGRDCPKISKVSSVIHLQGPARGSKQPLYLSLTPQVPSGLLDHMVQVVEQPVQQPGPVEEPSPVPGPTQRQQVSKSLGIWARVIYPSEECVVSRIQIDPLKVVLLSWWWEGPSATTYCLCQKEYLCMLNTAGLLKKKFTEVEGP